MCRRGAAADVREFNILNDRVLHVLLKRSGNDFLGLDVSDHEIAPLKEIGKDFVAN